MGFLRFILKWSLVFLAWISILIIIALFYYLSDLPSLDQLDAESDKQIVEVNYSNGERIASFGGLYESEVKYYELPQHLIDAVVATEDRRFFSHFGVDIIGIARAFYVNHKAGKIVQGGSTITQQLAKMLFLTPDRNLKRKVQEILLALQLEHRFTKEKILTFYLNRAYFGSGNYGIGNAAKFYFGKDVSQINLNEAAMIAGLLKAPSKLSPKNNQELAEDRANVVLSNMINAGFLNEKNVAEIDKAVSYNNDRQQRLYFADYVRSQFADFIQKSSLRDKVISINTTLDQRIQKELENVLNQFIEINAKKLDKSQVAVVIMDHEGAVLGFSGGVDYQKSQFNRAIYAKRQPGSSFKTFIYLNAFENGFKPDDIFEDKKISLGTWVPDNYESSYFGNVTLKTAFAKSLNSVAVQLSQKLDKKSIINTASRLGIISDIDKDDPTIALGTTLVSLYELTSAYVTIANDGYAVIPHSIVKIMNNDEKLLYERETSGLGQVISEQAEQSIKEVLLSVVKEGTGKNADIGGDIYGKTGTSQNFRDAWFVGFNDDYVVGVWIGNDNNSPTNKITGGSLPAALFGKILQKID
ncbi:MAG: PBP1A family penicillin-binding protein [Pelagibacterales bacterium]|nr:PBP1A family penicillin-binding protein [Pelagibacterales bacterium]